MLSRWLIVLLCTILHTLGAFLGLLIYAEIGDISQYWQIPFWVILGILYFYIPQNQPISYRQRNIITGIIYLCGFGILVGVGNGLPESRLLQKLDAKTNNTVEINLASAFANPHTNHQKATKKTTKAEKKAQRKTLRQALKDYRKTDNSKKGILIFLTILGALVVTFLLMAVSCSIACAGSELLAAMILAGGLGLIIWACIAIIRNINKRNFSRKES
jgi:hypothetical protein